MRASALVAVAAMAVIGLAVPDSPATSAPSRATDHHVEHVLVISVDGLHESDLTQWISEHPRSNLARLARAGTMFANASASRPTDSFPGLLSIFTGGKPKTTGVFYDDTFARDLYAPGSDCSGAAGTEAVYDESIDVGASAAQRTILGETIDPASLPETKVGATCTPVQPNDYLRTNTVFGVAHAAGLRTAWTDKHPAYRIVAGHGSPNAVDDLFTPEINADLVPATLVDTRGRTITFPHPNPTGTGPYFITDYVSNTEAYDQIKVDGILNQIDARTSAGTPTGGVPAIFGMNFQTVSVAEKDVDPSKTCDPSRNDGTPCDPGYVPGGYKPGTLAFTPQLEGGLAYVDTAMGSIVHELAARHLTATTQIILTAKHGQSPIDPSTLAKIGSADATVLANAGIAVDQITHDDISMIWLHDQHDTDAALAALRASTGAGNPARIAHIYAGAGLVGDFGNPRTNGRTPDIIVQPLAGTIYTTSTAKVAEHGGFAPDDTHVALLVVGGTDAAGQTVSTAVQTTQIAPTILLALGLDPERLDAVRAEHTMPLPGLGG